jgi:hypothetical protein
VVQVKPLIFMEVVFEIENEILWRLSKVCDHDDWQIPDNYRFVGLLLNGEQNKVVGYHASNQYVTVCVGQIPKDGQECLYLEWVNSSHDVIKLPRTGKSQVVRFHNGNDQYTTRLITHKGNIDVYSVIMKCPEYEFVFGKQKIDILQDVFLPAAVNSQAGIALRNHSLGEFVSFWGRTKFEAIPYKARTKQDMVVNDGHEHFWSMRNRYHKQTLRTFLSFVENGVNVVESKNFLKFQGKDFFGYSIQGLTTPYIY